MKLIVSQKSEQPIYEQVYSQLVSQILSGALPPDFCLPSIRGIAVELNISVITVKNAYDRLERDGFIYTRAGKGCFVCRDVSGLKLKRDNTAAGKLAPGVEYCKSIGLTEDEIARLTHELYLREIKL